MNRSALSLAGQLRRPARRCLFPGARLRYRARTLALSAALLPALALASAVRADQPPLSLPEAQRLAALRSKQVEASDLAVSASQDLAVAAAERPETDRKSTRLNSSHRCISYAVFCLKKKNNRLAY